MPLLVDGICIDQFESITDLVKKHPKLKESNDILLSKTLQTFSTSERTLYVPQREYAVTHPGDKVIDVIGSDDATTCHIMVIRHTGSGTTVLGHFDGSSTSQGIKDMLRAVVRLSPTAPSQGRLEVHIAGGFLDDKESSADLTKELISELQKTSEVVNLVTACCTDINDRIVRGTIHGPHLYGLGVNVKTGEIFPAQFDDKGPDRELRGMRVFTGDKEMFNFYDYTCGKLKIGPFSYQHWGDAKILLRFPDELLLKYTSTSPEVEPPYHAQHTRETLQFGLDHPNSAKHFPGGKPRVYCLINGVWKPDS